MKPTLEAERVQYSSNCDNQLILSKLKIMLFQGNYYKMRYRWNDIVQGLGGNWKTLKAEVLVFCPSLVHTIPWLHGLDTHL